MANWSLPTISSLYTDFVTQVKERDDDCATMFRTTPTNIVTNTIRWEPTNSRFEIYNGASWGELDTSYEINVTSLNGQLASYYTNATNLTSGTLAAARFNDTSHGNRGGGSLHANVVAAGNSGFMTGADKTKLDGIESGAKADLTAGEILTLIKTVDGAGTGLDADTLDTVQASSFVRSDQADSISGVLTYTAIPVFNGGTSGVSAPFTVDSNFLVTNLNADRLDGNEASAFSLTSHTHANVISSGAAGFMTGADKAKLDAIDTGATDDQTASEILTLLKTVDTNTSGLNADTLDGVQGASYLRSDATDNYTAGTLTFNTAASVAFAKVTGTSPFTVASTTKVVNLNADLLDGLDSLSFIRSDASDTVVGNTEWQDNSQVQLGTGSDLVLYHNASNSYIDNITGTFFLRQRLNSGDLTLQSENSAGTLMNGVVIGGATPSVEAYYNNSLKLATTNTGIAVTGTLTVSSSTLVSNLNADQLDGNEATAFATASHTHAPTDLTSTTGTGAAVLAVSPALTGTPTAPTAAAATNTTQIATTEWVTTELAGFSPGTNFARSVITATASQTVFTFNYNSSNLLVYLNGVLLLPTTDYTGVNGTTVTLTVAAALNDEFVGISWDEFSVADAVARTGDTMTGHLSVPAGATGAQVPQAQDVVLSTGDTMTGALVLNADPTIALGAATKQYADAVTNGQHTIWMPAGAMIPATTNGAKAGTVETTTNKIMISTLDFDTTTEEFAQFGIQMPKSWNEGTLVAQAIWSHAATTTNFGVVWGIEAVSFANDNPLDTAWGTEVVIVDTGGTTNDIYISPESSAITVAGSPSAEEYVMFRITRVVANGSDTMAIDARLHGIKIHYTTNAPTDD